MKLLAVNIAFREPSFYKRWRLLSQDYGYDVTLVGPRLYEYAKFGEKISFTPTKVDERNFRVRHIDMQNKKWLRYDWISWKYLCLLVSRKPDVIYLIGFETKNVIVLSLLYKWFFNRKCKVGIFTMRGIDMPMNGIEYRWRWSILKNKLNFVNVHYPRARAVIRHQGGYKGIINLQTQIGVDKDVFFPSIQFRRAIRERYGISEKLFVFGAAARIEQAKGIFEIIESCELLTCDFKFLLLGDGCDFKKIKAVIEEKKLSEKIILTGKIPHGEEVCRHLNAMDCFIHVPKSTKVWVDTFPVAVVQAMACALPVIASDSGAMQYQIGLDDMIVPEGDVSRLVEKMEFVAGDPTKSKEVGNLMFKRAMECFEIRHLNRCLSQTLEAVTDDRTAKASVDQTFLR